MTTTGGRSADVSSPSAGAAPRPPALADGTQLLGEMKGSGYRVPPALARRADGQVVQLTPLLYAVLAAVDGARDEAELAEQVRRATGRPVSAGNVAELLGRLRGLGLVAAPDGSEPTLPRSNPLLALRLKAVVTDPERTRRLTAPFAALFHPLIVVALVAVFGWICWWVLFERGLASATHDAFGHPGLLLAVFALTIVSAGFHEFGHAAAAHRGGTPPGAMGVGLYLIWPAFYTDVTDSYRLGRGGRLRTDLGGLYFNAIVASATAGVWWLTRDDALLLLIATQILQMLHQLMPLVRFDGYHVLADLTGVPDLFQRIGPTLRGLLPWHWRDPEPRVLKPWARTVVTTWVLVVVPVLAFTLFTLVTTFPRIVGTALASFGAQRAAMATAWGNDDVVGASARALAALVVLLPVGAMVLVLVRFGRRIAVSVWRRTAGHPVRRGIAVIAAAAVLAGIAWAWWPTPSHYRPVQAWEGGRLSQVLGVARAAPAYGVGSQGRSAIYLPQGAPRPTREHPMLALVLVPRTGSTGPSGSSSPAGSGGSGGAHPWIFPINQPLAPGAGDNQALAVNRTDNTVDYAVAFAMVWEDGSSAADNRNEAYALASCTRCAAVAVSFQVVFVTGHVDLAVPVNHAVALNYNCTSCLTYALAAQLFVTLDGPLSPSATQQLDQLWKQILTFAGHLSSTPLDQIQATLDGYEAQILAIVQQDQGPLTPSPSPSASTLSGASPSPTDGTTGSQAPAPSDSAAPTAGATPTDASQPSSTPTQESTASPSDQPTLTPTASPSQSASP